MQEYELMYILVPDLDEAGVEAATQRIRSLLDARGAEVATIEPWGRRRMAYPIRHHRDGYYVLARFKMSADQTDSLERALRLNEQVLRHLLIRLDGR